MRRNRKRGKEMNLIAHLQRQNNIITTFIYTWLIYSKVDMNKEVSGVVR